jgi:hypothetical protein
MLPGVFSAQKKDGTRYYRSSITLSGKHISLGSYPNEKKAHQAYVEAGIIFADPTLTLEHILTYEEVLNFEKKVSLLNYRDNGIYLKNPIYLRTNFFIYFLSVSEELKFDIDDLFYYSSHKIMRRKGHLFVSDYGMQVNILSRYGIKNYAVSGKDYLFVNGDNLDFRYSNIEIVNPYYGVTRYSKGNQYIYRVKIHIYGNYTVGEYKSAEIAAIAYNKAVDLAKKFGVKKDFQTNYIIDYSPKKYAEAYLGIRISERYLWYLNHLPEIKNSN